MSAILKGLIHAFEAGIQMLIVMLAKMGLQLSFGEAFFLVLVILGVFVGIWVGLQNMGSD